MAAMGLLRMDMVGEERQYRRGMVFESDERMSKGQERRELELAAMYRD